MARSSETASVQNSTSSRSLALARRRAASATSRYIAASDSPFIRA